MDRIFSVLANGSEVKSDDMKEFSEFMVEQIRNMERQIKNDKRKSKVFSKTTSHCFGYLVDK